MPDHESAIIEKIRKLHALAERASNEAEAAVAAARVQELLAKHNLEIGEVLLQEDPGASVSAGQPWKRIPAHTGPLARACCEMFDVLNYFHGGRYCGWRYVFIGLKDNVTAAALTYEYLVDSVEALARGAKADGLLYGSEDFRAFRYGAAERIHEMARERKAQAVADNPAYGQLVHIGNALARKLYDAKNFKGSRGGYSWFWTYATDAYEHGRSQGSRVDISGARTSRMLK